MTTIRKHIETCAICGTANEFLVLGSTNAFGSPDLDTRPPEMQRSTINFWVQRCPMCGYCAPRISENNALTREQLETDDYRDQLDHGDFPTLANAFLCWSLLQEQQNQSKGAGWAALHAAWLCDDAHVASASVCRKRAIAMFEQAQTHGDVFAQDAGAEQAILADLLRRTGQFEEVKPMCERGLAKQPSDVIRHVLRYQMHLASEHDDHCYRISDALEWAKGMQK